MAVAYSDRVVRLFKWVPRENCEAERGELVLLIKWELAGQVYLMQFHAPLCRLVELVCIQLQKSPIW